MPRNTQKPQEDRCNELRERINESVGRHHRVIGPAADEVRLSALDVVIGLQGASLETRRMLAVVVMAAASNGLLAALARDLDMPVKEVEEVFMEMVSSPAWRRV